MDVANSGQRGSAAATKSSNFTAGQGELGDVDLTSRIEKRRPGAWTHAPGHASTPRRGR